MTRTLIRVAIATIVSAVALTAVTAGWGARSNGPYVLRGANITVDETQGTSRMEGSLIGTWQATSFKPLYQTASQFAATGTELFTGCHDVDGSKSCDTSEEGTLRLTFAYWATFEPATGALVRGQCVHPIVGGTGAFKGARGVVYMLDTPTPDGVRTVYSGTLLYPGSLVRTTASRSLVSAAHRCGA